MPNIINQIALAVAGGVTPCPLENWRGGRTPDLAAFQVLEIDRLIGLIGYRIVRPSIDLVLLAIAGPTKACAFRRNLKAKIAIGDDVDPRRGSFFTPRQGYHIFPAIMAEAAHTVEELQIERLPRCECRLICAGLWTFLPVFLRPSQAFGLRQVFRAAASASRPPAQVDRREQVYLALRIRSVPSPLRRMDNGF